MPRAGGGKSSSRRHKKCPSMHGDIDGLLKDHSGAVLGLDCYAAGAGCHGHKNVQRSSRLGQHRTAIDIDLHE